jgi:hypothetical protein
MDSNDISYDVKLEIKSLLFALEHHSKERKKIRRHLFDYIRGYSPLFNRDRYIRRKINGGWLSDLCDRRIIENCKHYFLGE